jgi:hypothetical protein
VLLLVQLGGVLVLGALLGLLLRADAGSQAALGVTALALAVGGLAFWNGVWSTSHTFVEQVGSYPSTIHEANIAPGSLFPANEPLLEAAELALPRKASIYLICEKNSVGCSGEWISYQLSPRLLVANISEAQYVLVYGDSPRTVPATMHLPIVVDRTDGGVVRAKPA